MQRRDFFGLIGLVSFPGTLFAKSLTMTPSQAEGPFYPVKEVPLNANLIRNPDVLKDDIMHLHGRVVDTQGKPLSNVFVEIWQCDKNGRYDHPLQEENEKFDSHFMGFGATITDSQGAYQFRTSYPYPYPGRQPHIHVKVWRERREVLTTQIYLKGQTKTNEWFDVGREHLQIDPQRNAQGMWDAHFQFVI